MDSNKTKKNNNKKIICFKFPKAMEIHEAFNKIRESLGDKKGMIRKIDNNVHYNLIYVKLEEEDEL